MTAFFKTFLLVLVAFMGVLAPEFALAQEARPPGGTHWDLYVYGNGQVIYSILMGVKMLMVPDAGETGFVTLLLFMATAGFVVLAIAAGFDPGKNLLRMFTYILVVWMVVFGTTKLTASVVILDLARGADGSAATEPMVVDRAPALVVLPAALTSAVGQYFTRTIETYFTVPGSETFTLSGTGVGQFNLFGKMMNESTQYVITNPELKRSLSAYTADCVVPAMALGKLNGPVKGDDGAETSASGTQALLRTVNMVTTLGSAKNDAILTTYFPFSKTDTSWMSVASAETGTLGATAQDLDQYSSTGVVMSCTSAWTNISSDLEKHANLLMKSGADGWAKSGVMVPFETAMNTMIAQAAAPGAVAGANFSRPQGFILQQAMVNSMNGSFRQAAIQTGNNELMQAVALSQAEQQQKSAWSAAFSVFNNMMGYVFTVLQAFIFALTPLIVVALMVPGLGKAIFANYAQVLIWLTLWQPMLALINFIIMLFATESVGTAISMEGGVSMANKALLSEKTNDLMIAAGFLGTMTPLLSWGIVKGAMAFTEFISKGVGSEFASQAGAAAATGNLSMGNLSMGNVGMDKFSTQMSSAVGQQGVSAAMGAGALTTQQDAGGGGARINDAAATRSTQSAEQFQTQIQRAEAVSAALSHMQKSGMSESEAYSYAMSKGANSAEMQAYQMAKGATESVGTSDGAGKTVATNDGVNRGEGHVQKADANTTFEQGADGRLGFNSPVGGGANLTAGAKTSEGNSESVDKTAATSVSNTMTDTAEKDKKSYSSGASSGETYTSGSTSAQTVGNEQKVSGDIKRDFSQGIDKALSLNESYTQTLSAAHSLTTSTSANEGNSLAQVREDLQAMAKQREELIALGAQAQTAMAGQKQVLDSRVSGTEGAIEARGTDINAHKSNIGAPTVVSDRGLGANFEGKKDATRREIDAAHNRNTANHNEAHADAGKRRKDSGTTDPRQVKATSEWIKDKVKDGAGLIPSIK